MQFLHIYDFFKRFAHVKGLCFDLESLFEDVRDVLQVQTLKHCHFCVWFHVFQNLHQFQVLGEHVNDDIHAGQNLLKLFHDLVRNINISKLDTIVLFVSFVQLVDLSLFLDINDDALIMIKLEFSFFDLKYSFSCLINLNFDDDRRIIIVQERIGNFKNASA